MRLKVRYETPARRAKGKEPQTRAERNEEFGKPTPRYDWPTAGDYLWDMFWKINRERQDGPDGPQPISSTTLESWCHLRWIKLRPEEADILGEMDAAWRSAFLVEVAIDRKNAG